MNSSEFQEYIKIHIDQLLSIKHAGSNVYGIYYGREHLISVPEFISIGSGGKYRDLEKTIKIIRSCIYKMKML